LRRKLIGVGFNDHSQVDAIEKCKPERENPGAQGISFVFLTVYISERTEGTEKTLGLVRPLEFVISGSLTGQENSPKIFNILNPPSKDLVQLLSSSG